MTADDDGWAFFDSTESCVVDAASSALLIWAAVKGWLPWTNQSDVFAVMWNSRIACSVITVFGAETPAGSAPTSWMTGFRTRQPVGTEHVDDVPGFPLP